MNQNSPCPHPKRPTVRSKTALIIFALYFSFDLICGPFLSLSQLWAVLHILKIYGPFWSGPFWFLCRFCTNPLRWLCNNTPLITNVKNQCQRLKAVLCNSDTFCCPYLCHVVQMSQCHIQTFTTRDMHTDTDSTVEHTESLQKTVLINHQLLRHFQICLHVTAIIWTHAIHDRQTDFLMT